MVCSLRWFCAVFFGMALAVRYAAAEPVVQAIGAVTVVAAAACGTTEALRRAHLSTRAVRLRAGTIVTWVLQMIVAVLAGLVAAYAALSLTQGRYPETALLHAGAALMVTATAACGVIEWLAALRHRVPAGDARQG